MSEHIIQVEVVGFKQQGLLEQLPHKSIIHQIHCPCGIRTAADYIACPRRESPTACCHAGVVITPLHGEPPPNVAPLY